MSDETGTAITPLETEITGTDTAIVTAATQLARIESGKQIFLANLEMIDTCRQRAITMTNPQDWVLFRDGAGVTTARLCRSGVEIVRRYFGIKTYNFRPRVNELWEPKRETTGDTVKLTGICDAYCGFLDEEMQDIEVTKASNEDWIGRKTEADLKASLRTALETKVVHMFTGTSRVPVEVLSGYWGDTKSADKCRRGHGFGTSSERTASTVTDEGVKEERDKLRKAILQRTGGDKSAARDMLREVTASKPGAKKEFAGFDSIERLTQPWQVKNAFERLNELYPEGEQNG